MYERKQYSLKMRFEEIDEINALELSNLFSALNLAEKTVKKLSNEENQEQNEKGIVVNKIKLNSPLEIELIVTGFGAVYLLVQIFDKVKYWEKLSLEKEKLKLENSKLKSEIRQEEKSRDKDIDRVLVDLEELKLKLENLTVELLDNNES